jgi:photosystem II protein
MNATVSRMNLSSKTAVTPQTAALRAAVPRVGRCTPRLAVRAAKNPLKAPFQSKADYDQSAKKVNPAISAFTRRREVFAGRLAMTGFFSAVIGELLTGKGVIGQLSLETSLPPGVLKLLIAGIVAFNVITALGPGSPTFSEDNQRDVNKRPAGGVQKPSKISLAQNPADTLGVSRFGFTKRNEIFVGRVAMLGFAADLIGEQLTGGKGPLAQIGLGIGQPLNPDLAGFGLSVWIGFFLVAAVGYGGKSFGEQEGGEDLY